jgi:hypothetical protein
MPDEKSTTRTTRDTDDDDLSDTKRREEEPCSGNGAEAHGYARLLEIRPGQGALINNGSWKRRDRDLLGMIMLMFYGRHVGNDNVDRT